MYVCVERMSWTSLHLFGINFLITWKPQNIETVQISNVLEAPQKSTGETHLKSSAPRH
jgi:hypothetical protein